MSKTFSYMNTDRLTERIASASRYVIYAAPSVAIEPAKALVDRSRNAVKLHVVLDVDAEPMRLGLGDPQGLPYLFDNGIEIHKAHGLRIGVLVVDDEAWVYSPTPEIILTQPDASLSNAVKVSTDFALEMIPAVAPAIAEELNILDASVIDQPVSAEPEIGRTVATKEEVREVKESIASNPPVKFDHERHLRVYKSLFQFIKIEYSGGHITGRTIKIPSSLHSIAAEDSDLRDRIRSTCRLVDAHSPFTKNLRGLRQKVHRLRTDYACPLGKRYGSIILRRIRPEVDEKVEQLRNEIKSLSESIETSLQEAIDDNRKKLVEMLLPGVKNNPPIYLRARAAHGITDETAREYVEKELDQEIPDAKSLITKMQLHCDYKDITYEMLTDKGFVDLVKKKFRLDIETLHSEETAAGERSSTG